MEKTNKYTQNPSFTVARISLFYMTFWMIIGGIHTPFWQGWLENKGVTPKMIAILLGIAPLSRPLIAVVIAWLVDKYGSRKWIISALCFASAGVFYLFAQTSSLIIWIMITILWAQLVWTASSLMTSMVVIATNRKGSYGFSLKDILLLIVMGLGSLVALSYYINGQWSWINQVIFAVVIICIIISILSYIKTKRLDFAQLRLWGTIGTIIGITMISFYLYTSENLDFGYSLMVKIIVIGFFLLGIWGLFLPDIKTKPTYHYKPPAAKLLKEPAVILLLIIAAFLQGSHGMLYAQGTVFWLQKNYNYGQIGQFWALGNIGELILFTLGWMVKDKIRPTFILGIAGFFAMLRWSLIVIYSMEVNIIYLAMSLHGFTYAFGHLGAIYWMEKHIPDNLAASMQTLYTSLVFGVTLGINMILAGYYTSWFSAEISWSIMAAMGAVVVILSLFLQKFQHIYIKD